MFWTLTYICMCHMPSHQQSPPILDMYAIFHLSTTNTYFMLKQIDNLSLRQTFKFLQKFSINQVNRITSRFMSQIWSATSKCIYSQTNGLISDISKNQLILFTLLMQLKLKVNIIFVHTYTYACVYICSYNLFLYTFVYSYMYSCPGVTYIHMCKCHMPDRPVRFYF